MAKKSGLLQRQADTRQAIVEVVERIVRQLMVDTLQATVHDKGWGYQRITELTEDWGKKYNHYHGALEVRRNPEADYLQECLDRELADILKDHQALIPFEERYPDVRKITY